MHHKIKKKKMKNLHNVRSRRFLNKWTGVKVDWCPNLECNAIEIWKKLENDKNKVCSRPLFWVLSKRS